MKKLFSILSIAAISFAAITSCAKEEQASVAEEEINITVIAGDKDLTNDSSKTKTYVSEEGNTVHVYWQNTDKLKVLEVVDGEVAHAAESSTASVSDDKTTAVFQTRITGTIEGEHSLYVYTAIYPSECVSVDKGQYRVNIPRTQTLNGNNFASDADVLISEPHNNGSTRISNNSELSYNFRRLGTTVKMTLKGIDANEKLKKVEIESPSKISGYTNIIPATGETTEGGTTYSDLSLILDNYEVTGDTPVWFRVLSGTWNIDATYPLVIKAYTDKASYSKTINSTKELVFVEGGLTTFGVGLGNRTVNPAIADGDYIIAAKTSDNKYYAMSCEATGDRLVRTDVTEDFNTTEYRGDNYDLVWNFKTSSEGLAITTVNGDYLISSAKGASVGSSATYYSVEEKTVSEQKYYNIHNTSNYYLELNVGSGWYAFYNTDATVSMIRDLYVIPANVVKTPSITLESDQVSLPSGTTSYDINFTKRFLAGAVTAKKDSDENNIISNLSVEGNKVVVTLVPNTASTEKTATINICSESDNISVPFTITQQPFKTTTTDVLTAAILPATGSSYAELNVSKSTAPSAIQSNAVYGGYTAKSGENIQMNSNSGRGIWTTSSGGLVSTVSATYGNDSGKDISVYGKNSAFSSNSTDGATLIGKLNAKTLSVTATDDYEYILLIPNGATYPSSLSITWKEKAAIKSIAVKTAPTATTYYVGEIFNPAGLVITATYDDASTEDIAYAGNESKFTFNPSLTTELQTSNTSVEITYGGKTTTQGVIVKARPVFTVSPSNNSASPISVGEGEYDDEPISVTAGDDVVWTVTKVSGADDIEFTEGGTGSRNINVMIGANTGAARVFVLRVSSNTAGVSPASYDVYLSQEASSAITTVALATPIGLAYDNTGKKLTWNAVTTDVNGTTLVGYTPTYQINIDNKGWENASSPFAVSTLSASSHTAQVKAIGNGTTYDDSEASTTLEFNIPQAIDYATKYDSNVTLPTTGTNVSKYTVTINSTDYTASKFGSSKNTGSGTFTIPSGTTKVHVHCAGWKGDTTTKVKFSIGGNAVYTTPNNLTCDSAITGNDTKVTLNGTASEYYYSFDVSNITSDTTVTVESTAKRFVLFGVNTE
ncbi:MAG: bacterial Ig-like domain-containing protein [Bacteroidales bacterium]|nr:bacterial Ig-like domain-containing protein [Bacteroidales bacterium]